jgi:DNA-binding response OmpR family regulator
LAKILIVDDDEHRSSSFGSLLRSEGYEVLTSSDPFLFADMVELEAPDLVLIDVVMPKMSGDRMVRMIRDRIGDSCCPLLLWSSKPPEELEALALSSGADGFIYKSGRPAEVLEIIRKYLR